MAVKTSAAFTKAVMKPGRDFTLSMVIGPSKQTFDVANVLSLEIIESATSKKGVKIGQFCKNECKLTVLATAYDAWQGNTFQLYLKLAGIDDNVSLGKYWVYEVNTDDNYKTVVTAYDIPSWWAEAYSIKGTSVSAILSTMESKSGQTITNKSLLTLTGVTEVPEKATNQDMLAYIAGYDGYSVRTDRNGNLELYRYELPKQYGLFPSDTLYPDDKLYPTEGVHVTQSDIDNGLVISQDRIFQSGLKVDKNTTDINSVTVSNGTDNYTFGNGYGITYYNPYIKSAEQANKCASYIGFRYSAMTVKYIGNPALQAGDAIMVEVAPDVYSMCLIMEQKISFDGGLGITIDCYSDEADTLAIGTESPTMKKVEARYNELQTLIADMTKTLMGSERGYYRLLAADFDSIGGVSGYHTLKKGEDPAGFRIMNTPDYTSTTHGWQFTLQGLWYSNDGFKSFTNDDVGLTMDGKLLANLIRANSIIGGVIRDLKGLNYWNLDTGEFHLSAGTKVGDSTIANKADISASSEAITTSVSKTYQTMDGMSSYTKKAEIITAINNDTSNVKISADKLSLVFGDSSSQQIEMRSITDGVMFHGNGRIQMESQNQMGFWNYYDTSHSHLANALILQNQNESNPGITLANYRSSYDLANCIRMWNVNSSRTYNQIEFINLQYNGTSTANRMVMESSSNYGNWIGFLNYDASQVKRNSLYMNATASSPYTQLVNYDSSGNRTAELYLDQTNLSGYFDNNFVFQFSNTGSWIYTAGKSRLRATADTVGFVMDNDLKAYVSSDGKFSCFNGAYSGYGVVSLGVSGGDGQHPITFGWDGKSLICWVDSTQVWSTSDARMKKNIKAIENDYLEAVGEVELKEFNFNAQPYDPDVLHFGVVAQNVILHLKKHNLSADKLGMVYRVGKPGVEEDELAGAYCVDKEEFLIARVAYDEKRITALEEKLKEVTA